MSRKNRGSIMIIALIVFSIISTICITCISLTYSNINIASLELKNLQLKENALGAVEIVYGNIKNEVEYAIESCNSSQEYVNYFKKDNYKSFILKSKDISKSDLNNIMIEMTNKTPFGEVKNFEFEMKVSASENAYKKQIKVNIRIKNPCSEVDILQDDTQSEDVGITTDIENNNLNSINQINATENYEDEIIEDIDIDIDIDIDDADNDSKVDSNEESTMDDLKDNFKKSKLITIYNYEEI